MNQKPKFEDIVDDNAEKVYWLIRKMVVCHEDANDLTQDTFIKVWNKLDQYNKTAALSTWIYRIAVNTTLDFLKKKKEMSSLDDATYLLSHLDDSVLLGGDEVELKLQKALLTLPDKQRLVFNFRYYENRKYEEIADITNTSVGSLKASYHLAVKKVKKVIEI